MRYKLRPVKEPVVAITGASSGIGLATAQTAAARGAEAVLNSRDEHDLRTAAGRIRAAGGEAIYVVTEVANYDAVRAVGGIDTWVSHAGVPAMGLIEDVSLAAAERPFQTNYSGVRQGFEEAEVPRAHVPGCVATCPHCDPALDGAAMSPCHGDRGFARRCLAASTLHRTAPPRRHRDAIGAPRARAGPRRATARRRPSAAREVSLDG